MFFIWKNKSSSRPTSSSSSTAGLTVRHLLLLTTTLLTIVAISAIGWDALQLMEKNRAVKHFVNNNLITENALALNIAIAKERGFTASLLSNLNQFDDAANEQLSKLRLQSDQAIDTFTKSLNSHAPASNNVVIKQRLKSALSRIRLYRDKANQNLASKTQGITAAGWMSSMTQSIEDIRIISSLLLSSSDEAGQISHFGILIKDAFFDLNESLGKDRALIAMAIAQNRPFTAEELQRLSNHQSSTQEALKKIDTLLLGLPRSSDVMLARLQLRHSYKRSYLNLRKTVINSGSHQLDYPVQSLEWFQQATKGIESVLRLSHAIDMQLNQGVSKVREELSQTIATFFVTLAAVLIVYVLTFKVVFGRILHPLRKLEASAKTISSGDFTKALKIDGHDEFSRTADAFELMRNFLIDDRRVRAEKAEDELRKLSTAIEQSVSSIIMTDVAGIIEYVNPQFYRTTGYAESEVLGRKSSLLKSGATSESTYSELWEAIQNGRVWHGELLNKKKSGELYWEMLSISPVRNSAGQISHFISIQHDISKRKALEERLNFMAYHDRLTELPNRALLADRFNQMTAHADRIDSKVALLMLDLDHFKVVNDSLGHRVGDQLLIEVANRLKHATRSCDTLARYGGDEFVILLEDVSNVEVLVSLVNRLLEALKTPMQIEEHELHVGGSIGVSIWPDDASTMDKLLTKADTAMYHAKENGRAGFQFFTEEMNQRISQRLVLENSLRKAIEGHEFELYYQPQVCFETGAVTGVEALLRWNHPDHGIVPPNKFIPLAEEANLIKPIGNWALQTACAQAAQWKAAGYHDLSIAVNVSVRELEDSSFVPGLAEILSETGLNPALLELEITESSVMSNPDRMLQVLRAIKGLGVKLALDDFGTGYSSLSYLQLYPFDKLKIDRSFIRDIVFKPEDAVITQAITTMAHSLNMKVIAEGVETNIQAAYVRRCQCDEMQGYLISRPVPAAELEELLDKNAFANLLEKDDVA